MQKIRAAHVAGAFYPAQKEQLEREIKYLLSQKNIEPIENIRTIVVPHAGYMYSGSTAAAAYKAIAGTKYDNVIVISPSHYEYFEGCSIFRGNYSSPLGQIETQLELANLLVEHSENISFSDSGHHQEHALEVQLPFLQVVLKSFQLVPVVIGNQTYQTAVDLAESIVSALNHPLFKSQKTLIVCSSDLSHFYNIEKANILDKVIIDAISANDAQKLHNDIIEKKGEACGFGAILTGMIASKKLVALNSKILDYTTSGDVNKDYNKVVGYVSAVFYGAE